MQRVVERVCAVEVKSETKHPITFRRRHHIDNDLLTAVQKATEKMGIDDVCVKLNYNKRVFGFGVSFPIIYDKHGKPYDMSKPFNPDGLKGMDYRGFKVVDPYWLTPQFEEGATRDPLNERFGAPLQTNNPENTILPSVFCPYCGAPAEGDFRFCNRCGKELP